MRKFFWQQRSSIGLISTLLLLLTFCIGIYTLLNTTMGLRSTVWLATKYLPGKLTIQKLEGRLIGPIKITQLTYQDADVDLSIPKLQLDWELNFSHNQFVIKNLILDQAHVLIKPSDTESTFDWQQLLKHLKLTHAQIKPLVIQYKQSTLKIEGYLDRQWNLNWLLDIRELKEFANNLQGRFILSGGIRGTSATPELFVNLHQDQLIFNDWQIKKINGLFTINFNPAIDWQLKLVTPGLQHKKQRIDAFTLTAQGKLQPFILNMQLTPINFQSINTDAETIQLKLPASTLKTVTTPQGLRTEFSFAPQRFFNASANLILPNYFGQTLPTNKQSLQGNLFFSLHRLSDLNLLLPKLKNLQGTLDTKLHLQGTFEKPKLNGEIQLQNGNGQIPSLGLFLQNFQMKALFSPNKVQWTGHVKSGDGVLSLTGITQLPSATTLTLQGQNITVSNTKNYKITATPHLQIKADNKRVDVTGNIFLPRARINLGDSDKNTVVNLSNDVVFVDKKTSDDLVTLPIYSKINLRLGNDIKLRYEGLRSQLNGYIHLIDEPNKPTSAKGVITFLKGHYNYYSESLTMKEGSHILFTGGPVDNPLLDIAATKEIDVIPQTANLSATTNTNAPTASSGFFASLAQPLQSTKIIVGIRVQGNAQNPQLKLFSDPAILSQTDILSYLVTGQPSNQISAASAQILFNAASNLSGKGNDLKNLMKSIKQGVGLDQLSVQSTSYLDSANNNYTSNTSLVLGKALSPRLYINYSIGLLEPVNILQINYLLTKYFSLQSANSTTANSMDLLFKIEK